MVGETALFCGQV